MIKIMKIKGRRMTTVKTTMSYDEINELCFRCLNYQLSVHCENQITDTVVLIN